jgi:hypothetical protein
MTKIENLGKKEVEREERGNRKIKRGYGEGRNIVKCGSASILCSLIGLSFRCKYTVKDTGTYLSRALQRFYCSCVR